MRTSIVESRKRIMDGVVAAREMLERLERSMVNLGYTDSGRYQVAYGRKKARTIHWTGQKMFVGSAEDRRFVQDMGAWDLLFVADHVGYLLDELERNARFLADNLVRAYEQVEAVLKTTQADPRPAKKE